MVFAGVCVSGVRNYAVPSDLCDLAKLLQRLYSVFPAVWLYVVVVPQRLAESVIREWIHV